MFKRLETERNLHNMIEVKNLVKKYGQTTAVNDISFNIENGMIYGLLGPNGAGKTTTMNIMTGCLAATSGSVLIDGYDIFEQPKEAKRRIGYLPEQPPVYMDMTPGEYLKFVGEAKGLRGDRLAKDIFRVMELTGIEEMKNRLIKNLSKGYRQRVGLSQAILGDPETIILDEPTVGLDPKQIIEMRDLIRKLGQKHTVILSSHILTEVSAVCDRIMIISKGKLAAIDTPENLSDYMSGKNTLEIKIKSDEMTVRQILTQIKGVKEANFKASDEKDVVFASVTPEQNHDIREELFFAFAKENCALLEMSRSNLSLEDIFLRITDGEEEYEDKNGEDETSDKSGNTPEQTEENSGGEEYTPLFTVDKRESDRERRE